MARFIASDWELEAMGGQTERLAIAAHLHVLLRRQTGRVTDPEWMAINREYAREVIRFCREKAAEKSLPELLTWASKLEVATAQPDARPSVPLVQAAAQAFRQARAGEERELPAPGELPSEPLAPPLTDLPNPAEGVSSSFAETGFGESVINGRRVDKKGKDEPRYVGGLR